MKSSNRGLVVAIMVAMVLAAVETTVVTIAVPTIVKNLNGFKLISWIFSLYLLTSSITTPIYGKLSDIYGRKNTLSVGIAIFLLGSFLCGLSRNMYELIAFRGLQGMGSGAIYTITYTIVGDEFSFSERARVQGWLSSAWGISSLIGPFIGGFLIDTLSWHWIFFINIPFGILSIMLLQKNLKENFEKRSVKIDYSGILFITIAILSLLLGFLSGESNLKIIISVLISLLSLFIFYNVEKKAADPIMPFEIFTKSNVVINIISFISSAVLIGIDVYMSIYMQNVLGYGATMSGIIMAPMSITWFLATFFIDKKITKYGSKNVIILNLFIIVVGSICLYTLGLKSSPFLVILFVSILGVGFGGSFTTITIVIQTSVNYNMRGTATASNALLRNLGQTIGVSIFGNVFNLSIAEYLSKMGIFKINPNNLYSSQDINLTISQDIVKNSLNSGLHTIFMFMVVLDIVALVLSLAIINESKQNQ